MYQFCMSTDCSLQVVHAASRVLSASSSSHDSATLVSHWLVHKKPGARCAGSRCLSEGGSFQTFAEDGILSSSCHACALGRVSGVHYWRQYWHPRGRPSSSTSPENAECAAKGRLSVGSSYQGLCSPTFCAAIHHIAVQWAARRRLSVGSSSCCSRTRASRLCACCMASSGAIASRGMAAKSCGCILELRYRYRAALLPFD